MSLSIFSSPAGISSQNGGDLWNLVKARRESQEQRQEALGYVEQQLSSVLLGVELEPAEQSEYVNRLAQTVGDALTLQQGPEVPELSEAKLTRDLYVIKAGGIRWRPFPLSQRQVEVTPLHRRLQARMAGAIKQRRKMAPESLPMQIQTVGFSFAGHRQEDRVEISGWGVRALERDKTAALSLPAAPELALVCVSGDPRRSP